MGLQLPSVFILAPSTTPQIEPNYIPSDRMKMNHNDPHHFLLLISQTVFMTCLFSIKRVVKKQKLSVNNCLNQRTVRKRQRNVVKYLILLLFHSELSVQIYPSISHLHTSAHICFVPTALNRNIIFIFHMGDRCVSDYFCCTRKKSQVCSTSYWVRN